MEQIEKIKEYCIQIYNELTPPEKELFDYPKCVLCDGDVNSKLMIIARDLGADEVKREIPLIGAAGQLVRFLESLYLQSNILTQRIYITNIVPFKPKDNKVFPLDIRVKFLPILKLQILLVKPKAIIALGNEALSTLSNSAFGLGIINETIHGKIHNLSEYFEHSCPVIPSCHPSYLLRKGVTINTLGEKNAEEQRKYFQELLAQPMKRAIKIMNNGLEEYLKETT